MKRIVRLGLSLLVTAAFTFWAFRDTDWPALWAALRSANYLWVVPYVGILLAIHLARTLRWGCLLSGIGPVPFSPLNQASGIGFMMLLILPFRLGELARPYLIARRTSVGKSEAMTTVVLERIVDGLSVALMLRVLMLFMPTGPGGIDSPGLPAVRVGSWLMFAIFGGGLLFLVFAHWQRERAITWVRTGLGWLSPRAAELGAGMVDRFVGALRKLPGPTATAGFFLYTALYWGLNGFGMFVLARAFDASLSLTLFQAYVVLCVLVVGLMIPAAPGMVGTFQAFVKVGLGLFLPPQVVGSAGLAFANVLWLCQTAQQILLGLLLFSLSQLSLGELTHPGQL